MRRTFCIIALGAGSIFAGETGLTVMTAEGDTLKGARLQIKDDMLVLDNKSVPLANISEIVFASEEKQSASPITLHFRNGDYLRNVDIVSGTDTKLKFKTKSLGETEVENKFIHTLVFTGKTPLPAEQIDAFLRAAAPKEDLLLTVKGEQISGFFEKLTDKELTFNAGNQSRTYAFDQLAAFRLAPLEAYTPAKDLRGAIQLRDGSRLTGRLAASQLESGLSFFGLNEKQWKLPADALQSIVFSGGKLVHLSALAPKSVEEKPYIGGGPFVFKWRKDRSASNGKLQIGAVTYERGIGVHSYSKLTYDLGGQFARFSADVGLDTSAPSNAVCSWKILVDGKEAAQGIARAGGEKAAVKFDVINAKQLELICDFGPDDDDAGDHLNWANARLIKP